MDGVVADFDGYAHRELGIESKPGFRFSQEDWGRLREFNQRIYRDVPLLPTAISLINQLRDLKKQYNFKLRFLTAIPKENDLGWAYWDKVNWVIRHFPGIPVFFGPYSIDKQHHYKPGDVLIDDRISNIEEWPGFSILHNYKDIESTLTKLKDYLGK